MDNEELMSPETIGKYLAKTKASKTQVTPVRKQDADFRVEPSLTGPATIKRKLGDNEGYPRGFNPQQMQDVRDVEASGALSLYSNAEDRLDRGSPGTVTSAVKHYTARLKQFADGLIPPGTRYPEAPRLHPDAEKSKVREIIARSKVDPKSFFSEPVDIDIAETPSGVAGEAYPKNLTAADKYLIRLNPSFVSGHLPENDDNYSTLPDKSLIHEMGHVKDFIDQDNEDYKRSRPSFGSAQPDNPTKRLSFSGMEGVSEGIADDFSDKNFVPHPKAKNAQVNSQYRMLATLRRQLPNDSKAYDWAQGYMLGGGKPLTEGEINDPKIRFGSESHRDVLYSWKPLLNNRRTTEQLADSYIHPETGTPTNYGGLISFLTKNHPVGLRKLTDKWDPIHPDYEPEEDD
jgi:hypothetical protein